MKFEKLAKCQILFGIIYQNLRCLIVLRASSSAAAAAAANEICMYIYKDIAHTHRLLFG